MPLERTSDRTRSGRRPSHPGHLLRDEVLPGLELSVSQAARELRITRQTLHRILAGTAGITPDMAARLGRLSGLSAADWLTLQQIYDLHHAETVLASVLAQIPTHTPSTTLRGMMHDYVYGH